MRWLRHPIAYAGAALLLVAGGFVAGVAVEDRPAEVEMTTTTTTAPLGGLTAEQREERRLECIEKELGIGNPMDWPTFCP